MTHIRSQSNGASQEASFSTAYFLFVEKNTFGTTKPHLCVMNVITKWEQFSHVIVKIFSNSRDDVNVGILKGAR